MENHGCSHHARYEELTLTDIITKSFLFIIAVVTVLVLVITLIKTTTTITTIISFHITVTSTTSLILRALMMSTFLSIYFQKL
jgi:hypothetical protein